MRFIYHFSKKSWLSFLYELSLCVYLDFHCVGINQKSSWSDLLCWSKPPKAGFKPAECSKLQLYQWLFVIASLHCVALLLVIRPPSRRKCASNFMFYLLHFQLQNLESKADVEYCNIRFIRKVHAVKLHGHFHYII